MSKDVQRKGTSSNAGSLGYSLPVLEFELTGSFLYGMMLEK